MRSEEERIQKLELLVEQLIRRVDLLEGEPVATQPTPAEAQPPPAAVQPAPAVRFTAPAAQKATPAARPKQPPKPGPSLDLEELLGGRVLAWAGALAVVIAIVLFLATAISRGWIDEAMRVVLAYLGSTLLLCAGLYLYERKGRTQAALATVAAALFGLFASTVAATSLYDIVEPAVGLAVAMLIGAGAATIAVRWGSRETAAIGIVGAVLSPVLVDAGTTGIALAFMAVALVSSTAVLLWQRWDWLAVAAFLTSAPQLVAWLDDTQDESLGTALLVLGCFWVLYAVAAIGFEVRVPSEKLRFSSAGLLVADAILAADIGWEILDEASRSDGATTWVLGLAVVHLALGAVALRGRVAKEIALLLLAIGVGLSAIGAALALDGPALVAAWSVEAVLLAWLARRMNTTRGYIGAAGFLALASAHTLAFDARPDRLVDPPTAGAIVAVVLVIAAAAILSRLYAGPWAEFGDAMDVLALGGLAYLAPVAFEGVPVVAAWATLAVVLAFLSERGLVGLGGVAPLPFVALAAGHTLAIEAPPYALRDGVDDLGSAVLAIGLTTAAALVAARMAKEPLDRVLAIVGAAGAVYLPSIVIVDVTSTGEVEPGQTPQVLLSAFWSAVGLGAVVYGLVRDDKRFRLGGLALLVLAAGKVILYDLGELDDIYRVLSFVALGLLLLAGAFAYQRIRHEVGGRPG